MNNALIEFVNSSADRWLAWVIAVTLDSAALLVVIGLVWLAIRHRVSPQVGYGLFLLVPLKLLLPFDVVVPWKIADWTPSTIVSTWFVPAVDQRHVAVVRGGDLPGDAHTAVMDVGRQDRAAAKQLSHAELSSIAATGPVQPAQPGTDARSRVAAITTATIHGTPEDSQLSFSALVFIGWLTGGLWLLVRMLRMQWRFHSRLKYLVAVNGRQLGLDFADLCRRAGVTQPVRIVEADDLTSPAVWGIFRPTIILPRGIASTLTARQLQWVLLHELAHIRRRDLLVVVVQRCATLLHFFNPAVWIANRICDRLREYACDDLADAAGDGSAADSSEAFVQILRHVSRSRQSLDGALGVFGWDSRASCFLRVRRLLDSDRPIRTRPNRWALCGLLLLAAVALPHLRAGSDPAPSDAPNASEKSATQDQTKLKSADDEPLAADVGEFELRVVGPDGKPVSEAMIHVNASTTPTAEEIRRGKFVRKASYGAYVKADDGGRMVVAFPDTTTRFEVSIEIPGYGPYTARWSSEEYKQPVPARFTAELEAAWSVGGIIVDSDGKPIAGATVHPGIDFKKRPGDTGRLGIGTEQTTDRTGTWRFDSVPASMSEIFVEISHAGYMPNRRDLTRREFGLEPGQSPLGKVVLDRGLTVIGKVTNEVGQPIAGALVRTKFVNDIREAKTGDDGVYRLGGCEPRQVKIVVSAKGRATDMQEVVVDPEMPPVNFQMQPGGKIRLRVLDQQGLPVPKARILFQRWRSPFFDYFEFGHVNQYADEHGVWEWNEAPLDGFQADICPPDAMCLRRQPLIARDEEYVLRTPPALVISGRVIDAKTKKPIEKFAVVPGSRFSESSLHWSDRDRFTVADGKYSVRHTSAQIAHLIRIEAHGYQAAVSRDIKSDEGNVSIDFELERGTEVVASVLTPQGRAAAKAQVALGIAGSQISVLNGGLRDISTFCAQQETNEAGRFQFPAQEAPFQLVILHPTGYAHVTATPDSMPETIKLHPWARVEGTYRVGKNPVPDVAIEINVKGFDSYGKDVPRIHTQLSAITDAQGRFVFERVFPGSGRIGREVVHMVQEGVIPFGSSGMMPANFSAGETTRIDLGGTGRPVVGKLQPPKNFNGMAKWQFAEVHAGPRLADPPMPDGPDIPADVAADNAKRAAWMLKWQQTTPAGKAWKAWADTTEAIQAARNASPYFNASVNRDGTFRIDDLPAGEYSLSVGFDRDAPGFIHDYHFEVPALDGSRSDEPLDLGVLTLQNQ